MPILQSAKRKNLLNLNKNVTIGVTFPLDEKNMFQGTTSVLDQIKSNLLNVLLTYPGERINLPNFGVGLKQLIFEQKIDLESLKNNIQSQINRYVPDIKLKGIRSETSENEHAIAIYLTYNYLLDNSEDTIQLNFNY